MGGRSVFRGAWGSLRRNPGYAGLFVLTLGLAIGVNSAVFSVISGVLLKPLPFKEAERIVYVQQWAARAGAEALFSFDEVQDYRESVRSFDEVVEFGDWQFSVVPTWDAEPHRAIGGLVTSNYFEVLGMRPAMGRTLTPRDDGDGAEPVMVLTHEYWERAFGGDESVLDVLVELSGNRTRIVGVLEPGVHYTGSRRQDFYVNYATNDHYMSATMQDERTHRMTDVFARLAPGVQLETARAEVLAVGRELRAAHPEAYPESLGYELRVSLWQDELTREARPVFLLLMGTVAAVLLLACANLANLTLTRLIRREPELATRGALGATPGELRRLQVAENVILAFGGGLLGLALAVLSKDGLAAYASRFTVRAEEVGVDLTVLGVTLVVSMGVAILLAFLPGMPVAPKPGNLSFAAGRSTSSASRRRFQQGLVVAQLALSFALLSGAGLLVRSLLNLQGVDPGFATENVLTLQAFQSFASQGEVLSNADVFRTVLSEVESFPGVRAAGMASFAPLGGANPISWRFRVEGGEDTGERATMAAINNVTPGYFEALDIPILAGRAIHHMDRVETDTVAVLSRSLAEAYLGNEEPIGRRISVSFNGQVWSPWYRVVGVVEDAHHFGLGEDPVPVIYVPAEQAGYGFTMVVATRGEPGPLVQAIKDAIRRVDPSRPVDRIQTIDELLAEDVAPARLNATLFGSFAFLALVIAGVGVLGVLAFSVSQRTREFGLRMAIGADQARVMRSVMGEGTLMVVLALLIGTGGALGLSVLLSGLLFGVEPFDLMTLTVAASVLGAVALVAAWVPARRATRVDPMQALRSE